MRHTHVFICQSDEQTPDVLTELACFALPAPDVATIPPETVLDTLETTTQETGNAVMRRLLQVQWAAVDALLVEQHCQQMAPARVTKDGHKPVTVASCFGRLRLERQICVDPLTHVHSMPGNAVLPPHHGMIITRGLQAWACLLAQDLSFVPVARLLGWQTHEAKILSATTLRNLVRLHGRLIQQAEQAEVVGLLQRDDLALLTPQLVPVTTPRRRAGWQPELGEAVDLALAAGAECLPQGILQADWARFLDARRQDAALCGDDLRHLGPTLEPEQVLPTVDTVLTPTALQHHFWEVRTAQVITAAGTRYLSGSGEEFLQALRVLTLVCVGTRCALLVLADGARWIRAFYGVTLAAVPARTMLLDWWHLCAKCTDLASRFCRGWLAKERVVRRLQRHLWRGDVAAACTYLESYRPQARNVAKLDELCAYVRSRQEFLPDYRARYTHRQYIGSGHVEKVNDLLVARRQKGGGRHWSQETSAALATLRTLHLNDGWHERHMPSLIAA